MSKLQRWLIIIALWIMATAALMVIFPLLKHHEVVTAWATVVAAGIAVWAVIQENRRSRFALSIDIVLKLDERFDSRELKEARKKTAKSIEAFHENTCKDEGGVLEFFTTIGILLRREVLDKEILWRMFFYWVHGYYSSLRAYINHCRKEDPASFDSLIYLYNELLIVENKINRGRFVKGFKKAEFLKAELNLLDSQLPSLDMPDWYNKK
jgi:hypothetical protein